MGSNNNNTGNSAAGGNNLMSNGALFRANPQALKSPLPFHLTLQHMQNGGSVGALFRPQAGFSRMTGNDVQLPPTGSNDVAASPGPVEFKVPNLPARPVNATANQEEVRTVPATASVNEETEVVKRDDEFNINDYLDLNAQQPAIESVSLQNAALESVRPIDDEIKSLVDSIHTEVTDSSSAAPSKNVSKEPEVEEEQAPMYNEVSEQSDREETKPSSPVKRGKKKKEKPQSESEVDEEVEKIEEPPSSPVKQVRKKKSPYDQPPPLPKSSAAFGKYCEKFPGVHFEKWWLLPLKMEGSTTLHLVVEGMRKFGRGTNRWHSSVITEIKGKKCAVSKSGNQYWLHGDIDMSMMSSSMDLAKRFESGFFDEWEDYLQDLFLRHSGNSLPTQTEPGAAANFKKPAPIVKTKENVSDERFEEPPKSKPRSKSHSRERRSSGEQGNKTPKTNTYEKEEDQEEEVPSGKRRKSTDAEKMTNTPKNDESGDEKNQMSDKEKKSIDKEKRRHTLAALSASRNSFGVSRSGRKIKPPAEFWDAQNYEIEKKDEPATVLKLEWGTGKIAFIETSEKRTRRSTISHDNRRKSDMQSTNPDSAPVKRGKGRPRKLVQGKPSENEDDAVDQFEDLSDEGEQQLADSQVDDSAQEDDDESEEEAHSSPKSKPSRKALKRTYYGKSETEEEDDEAELESQQDQREWSKQEDDILQRQVIHWDPKSKKYWKNISENIPSRTAEECQRRFQFISTNTAKNSSKSIKQTTKPGKKSNNRIEADGLGGKNTLTRKRQVRKMVEERARGHDDDFFGEEVSDEDEQQQEKPKKFYGNKRKQDSASEMDMEDDEQEQESPNVLKPFNRDDKDGYIESLKRRKIMQKTTSLNPKAKAVKLIKADTSVKRHKYPMQASSTTSEDEEEDDQDQRRPQALDYYAGNSSD